MKKRYIWTVRHDAAEKKSKNWYITIGIVTAGATLASFIVGNILFGFLLLIGGFAIMLAGSRPAVDRTYALSDGGLHIDERVIPWASIERFCLKENSVPPQLVVATKTLLGTTHIPLINIDYRAVRTEFKNNNVDEEDELDSLIETITEKLGL